MMMQPKYPGKAGGARRQGPGRRDGHLHDSLAAIFIAYGVRQLKLNKSESMAGVSATGC